MKVPPGGPLIPDFQLGTPGTPGSRRAHSLTPEQLDRDEQQKAMKRAREARDDANREMEMTERHLREAQIDSAEQMDRLRDQHHEEIDAELGRQSTSLRMLQQEGYQQIASLKRRQAEELARVQREGEAALAETQRHYRESLGRAESEGNQKLRGTLERNAQVQAYEDQRGKDTASLARQGHEDRLRSMKDANDAKFGELQAQQEQALGQARENLAMARENSRQAFEQSFQELAQNQRDTLDALNSRSSAEVRRIRDDSSQKLAAYEDRQEDPFYRLRTFDARFEERDDAFVLRARVPVHERKNISVSVQAEQVTLTASRRNIEKLEKEPGRTQSTANFQSITESFPLSFPVDSRAVSRTFDGEELVVTLPKKTTYKADRKQYRAPVERSRVERPEIPENIPFVQRESRDSRLEQREPAGQRQRLQEPTPPDPRRPGGRTLG